MTDKKQKEFLELYESVHARFERFCRARVYGKMDFRDLMNESLLVAFEKFDTLRSKQAFLSFLFGISIRILSNSNKKKKEEGIKNEDQLTGIRDLGNTPEQQTDIILLYEALNELPDQQRESLILFEISGFSIKEIAELHQVGESAVKQRLKRGREKLFEILNFESSLKMGEISYE